MTDDRLLRLVRQADPLAARAGGDRAPDGLLARVLATPRPARRAVRLRRRATGLVALGFAIVLVPAAVAFHQSLFDLIAGKPAPPSVQNVFRMWNRMHADEAQRLATARLFTAHFPTIDASHAEGVFAVDTPSGEVSLWEAPSSNGGQCWLFVFGAGKGTGGEPLGTSGACDVPSVGAGPIDHPATLTNCALPDEWIVHIRVHSAAAVRLEFADGRSLPMQIVAGHAVASGPFSQLPSSVTATTAAGASVTYPVPAPIRHLALPVGASNPGCVNGSAGGSSAGTFGSFSLGGGSASSSARGESGGATTGGPASTTTPSTAGLPTGAIRAPGGVPLPGGMGAMRSTSGTIVALGPTSLTVGPSRAQVAWTLEIFGTHRVPLASLTCTIGPSSPSLAGYRLGEGVGMSCADGKLVEIDAAVQWSDGVIRKLSAHTIAVGDPPLPDGRPAPPPLVCSFGGASAPAARYRAGRRARIDCVGNVLAEIGPSSGVDGHSASTNQGDASG